MEELKMFLLKNLILLTVRAVHNTQFVHKLFITGSPSGTVTFRINSGTAGDIYRVYMGNQKYLVWGHSTDDFTKQYNDVPKGTGGRHMDIDGDGKEDFTFPNDGWKTSLSGDG